MIRLMTVVLALTAASPSQAPQTDAALRKVIVGSWVLTGERYGQRSSIDGRWQPPETRRTLSFRANGLMTRDNNPPTRWSIAGGSLQQDVGYSVGIDIKGDILIQYHQPTSSYNAWAERWQRVKKSNSM